MNISIFTGGLQATLYARFIPLSECLKNNGIDVDLFLPYNWGKYNHKIIKISAELFFKYNYFDVLKTILKRSDIVFMGRTATPQAYIMQEIYKKRKIKFIFDLDDCLFIRRSSIMGVDFRPNSYYLEKIISRSDFVTVNGHFIKNYVKRYNSNCEIVYEPLDFRLFKSKKNRSDRIVIGWEGDAYNHYDNLMLVKNSLEQIAKEYDILFRVSSYLGDENIKKMFSKLEKLCEVDYGFDKWVPYDVHLDSLRDVDIFLSPLENNPFRQGKSSLRCSIGFAFGSPVIGNPVGEQRHIIEHDINGFLVKTEKDWVKYLKILIEDDNKRNMMGKKGKEKVINLMSKENISKRLKKIINKLDK